MFVLDARVRPGTGLGTGLRVPEVAVSLRTANCPNIRAPVYPETTITASDIRSKANRRSSLIVSVLLLPKSPDRLENSADLSQFESTSWQPRLIRHGLGRVSKKLHVQLQG